MKQRDQQTIYEQAIIDCMNFLHQEAIGKPERVRVILGVAYNKLDEVMAKSKSRIQACEVKK